MLIRRTIVAVAAAAALAVSVIALTESPASAAKPFARAELRNASGIRVGDIRFTNQRRSDKTVVSVRLSGYSGTDLNRFHGFHIHANDNPANGEGCIADAAQPPATWFVSADGHWKLDPAEVHGNHAGDLPSVFVNSDGTTEMRYVISKLTPAQVIGRAVMLHAGADNFGNVPVGAGADQYTPGTGAVAKTQATGNAGDRISCGVIARG